MEFMDNNNGKNEEGFKDGTENSTKNYNSSDIPKNQSRSDTSRNTNQNHKYMLIAILLVIIGIAIQLTNRNLNKTINTCGTHKIYWTYDSNVTEERRNSTLKHVRNVLKSYGYQHSSTNKTTWNLLWAHSYPFTKLYPNLSNLKRYQKVNHYPGIGHITSKVDLATTDSKYIPKAFRFPKQKSEFLKYAKSNPSSKFMVKSNNHRGIRLMNVSDVDVVDDNSFVQEFVTDPFLVDGYKFDIGVYVVITSVNPLRAYWHKSDVLFRYCPRQYYPFDHNDLDKYVIRDEYRPTWKVPSLTSLFKAYQFGMKDSFDTYLLRQGKNPNIIWEEIQNAIADILVKKERHIVDALKNYASQDNFFEMVRFDLILDKNLKVYLIEANMSPNLSSSKFHENKPIYENVLHSLFSITGVAGYRNDACLDDSELEETEQMMSVPKHIAVNGLQCLENCTDSCENICGLCYMCLDEDMKKHLLKAHREYLHRGDFRRIFPPAMKSGDDYEHKIKDLSETNKLQYIWYQSKCNNDITYCT